MKCKRCETQKYSISISPRNVTVQRLKIGEICPKCWGIELDSKWEEFSKEKCKKIEESSNKKPKFYNRTKCQKCGSVRLKFIKKPTEIIREGTRQRAYNETSWYYVCKKCNYNSKGKYSTDNPK